MPAATLQALAPSAAIALLWFWAGLGRRQATTASAAPRARGRFGAVSAGLGLCLVVSLGLVAAGPAAAGGIVGMAVGVVGASAVTLHVALDPARTGFWHHRRLRPLGFGLLLAAGLLLGAYLSDVALLPLVFASLVFQRHLGGTAALLAQSRRDIEDLQTHNQSLVAALALPPPPRRPLALASDGADTIGDKSKKAG